MSTQSGNPSSSSRPIEMSEEDLKLAKEGKFEEVHQRKMLGTAPVPMSAEDLRKARKKGKSAKVLKGK
jgi:hypothetical protein